MQVMTLRSYASLGGAGAGAATAALWVGGGAMWWWSALMVTLGVLVGAVLGTLTGQGLVKEEWSGWVGALLVPTLAVAVFQFLVSLLFARG
jgi:hypothetical protein